MEWQHPEALYLILPLCAAWLALGIYSIHRRHWAREAFAAQPMWSRILPVESRMRFWIKLVLREVAIIAGLVALAGPKFGVQYEQVIPRGSDLYALIDVSRSMLADDVPPSRLGRAKADVLSLVNRLQGERIGLIAFAGQAVVKCPLTIDYDSFRRALEELDPDSAPRGGTAIGDAIRKGLEVFHAKSDRDQAMLLISDGDDQQSYPLEAAAVAAERHVTIFTVGLGDADRGARVPQKIDAKSYIEYKGEQVWSKLDNSLLEQIAIKTSGVYIPAGTKAYDLGELYADHLQGRHGDQSTAQQRIRRSERFQGFLAIALIALLIDLCILPYRRLSSMSPVDDEQSLNTLSNSKQTMKPKTAFRTALWLIAATQLCVTGQTAWAIEPNVAVRDGLKLYSSEKYDEAREKFAAAAEELEKKKSAAASVAAFDEACACHKKGDLEQARERYLRAGLSQDLQIATSAHFNLGTLAAEQARKLCGDRPELVAPDKRQEILDQLLQAVASYRHCLELKPDHVQSRRNLELVRQWIKYYSDQWRERDRQKRRDESNLLQFLEYLVQTQTALRDSIKQLPAGVHSDAIAELKRAQDELREEIPTLREKIANDLRPSQDPNSPANNASSKELEEGIATLREWADNAGKRMSTASSRLESRKLNEATTEQQSAIEELDRIWEAIIPFQPLLNRMLADQTSIANSLNPRSKEQEETDQGQEKTEEPPVKDAIPNSPATPSPATPPSKMQISERDMNDEKELQTKTLKRSRQLAPKAEMELQRLAAAPEANDPANNPKPDDPSAGPPQPGVDPEQAKEGFLKAVELAPQAVEQMEAALKAIEKQDRQTAGKHAESARKILEEIQQAQPKNEQKQDQQNQDQQQKDDQKKDDQQKQDEKKNEDQKKKEKPDQKNENEESKKDSKDQQKSQASHDRLEDALRKVREREQEKRERDKKLKALFLGRTPVDKDW